MESEVWRVIPGFPDYQISTYKRVVSLKSGTPKLLSVASGGQVNLTRDGRGVCRGIGALYRAAFPELAPKPTRREITLLEADLPTLAAFLDRLQEPLEIAQCRRLAEALREIDRERISYLRAQVFGNFS